MKGRIYERRTDISPDGKHMIYFAMNGKWSSETRGAWTAVSKAPYLKALDLFAKGDCWEGGGLFLSTNRYWVNDRYYDPNNLLYNNSSCLRDEEFRPDLNYGAECTGVYYPRLLRDGWKLIERADRNSWNSATIFEKPLLKDWVLRKVAHEQIGSPVGKGCYWDEHELVNSVSKTRISCPDWEWADWEQDTLVWAEAGKLYRAGLSGRTELRSAKLLHDFNSYTFEAIEAPY